MKIAVATSLYEAGMPFLDDWIRGVEAAGADGSVSAEVSVCAAVHDLTDPAAVASRLERKFATLVRNVGHRATIAEVRRHMLDLAADSTADLVVFCDMDDMLAPSAFAMHSAALVTAPVSVANLKAMDAQGHVHASTVFGRKMPETVDRASLRKWNWCGFSNTAMRRDVLALAPKEVPDVVAVDWFIFTEILKDGVVARGSHEVVAFYRQYGRNTLGANACVSTVEAVKRLRIAVEHFKTQGEAELARVALALSRDQTRLERFVESTAVDGGAWFADCAGWCETYSKEAMQ